jgi:energy-coupling factor transporter transmembrane protein EcfT
VYIHIHTYIHNLKITTITITAATLAIIIITRKKSFTEILALIIIIISTTTTTAKKKPWKFLVKGSNYHLPFCTEIMISSCANSTEKNMS